jgi:hypothetical protein
VEISPSTKKKMKKKISESTFLGTWSYRGSEGRWSATKEAGRGNPPKPGGETPPNTRKKKKKKISESIFLGPWSYRGSTGRSSATKETGLGDPPRHKEEDEEENLREHIHRYMVIPRKQGEMVSHIRGRPGKPPQTQARRIRRKSSKAYSSVLGH